MSDLDLEMGKKRSRQQSSNVSVAPADSSESGDGAIDKTSPKVDCTHIAKSVDGNQIKKNIILYINGKKLCAHCKDGTVEDILKVDEGNDDFFICLRCGAKTCSVEHSSLHYDVPRSDSHALALKIPAFTVWCHACKIDIPSAYTKKLKTCVISIEQLYNKQINLQPLSTQESRNSQKAKDESVDDKESKSNEPIPLPPPKKAAQIDNTPAVRGLTNLGNTCFFNSVLQCLAQTPGLVEAIREMETPDQPANILLKNGTVLKGKLKLWDTLSDSLIDTLVKLQSGGPVVTPDRLLTLLTRKQTQFQGYRQQDAHELFTYLIDSVRTSDLKRYRKLILSELGLNGKIEQQGVSEETKKKLKALDHEISETITFAPEKVFKGRLVNKIECQECRSVKTFEESFLDLSLPIVSDKPQPPCMRRKGGHQQYNQNQLQLETLQEESKNSNTNSGPTLTKSQLKKEKRMMRKKNRKQAKNNNCSNPKNEEGDSLPAFVEDNASKDLENQDEQQQDSDVEGDVEDNSEETNCGSRKSVATKDQESEECANTVENFETQDNWVNSNKNSPASVEEKDEDAELRNSTELEFEESLRLMKDLIKSYNTNLEQNLDNKQSNIDEKNSTSSCYLENKNLEEKSNDKKSNCDAQVAAWLSGSNLNSVPDTDETERIASPPINLEDNPDGSEFRAMHNSRLSPQTQTSVYSNHQSSQPSLETRSSFLTATQEAQESGYCSEKLGCPESPQRGDSPSSLDGVSPAWSRVEGALSSRSDVSIDEEFNNVTTSAVGDNEPNERAKAVSPSEGSSKMSYPTKKSNWMDSSHPSSHVRRRRPPSPPVKMSRMKRNDNASASLESDFICNKWLEDSSNITACDEKLYETAEGSSIDKSSTSSEGKKRNNKAYNLLDDIYETSLGDIPEEENNSGAVVFGPLNKDQLLIEDLDASDSNSNELPSVPQGLIARPGSPYEECNDSSDLKNLEINSLNVEENVLNHTMFDTADKEEEDMIDDTTSDLTNARKSIAGGAGGDNTDYGLSCGCNKITLQRQDSFDSCCLHTSLAQSTQAELMTGCNKIICDTCTSGNADGKSVYTNSTKQTLISQAPPVLVIHLKRFQVQMMNCRKLCRHVSFPLQLDLSPYSIPSEGNENAEDIKRNLLYTLYGLVEHSGTMNGGHYVSYVKVTRGSTSWWYCISDSHVSQVSESRVLSAQAYLLFYKRIST